MPGCQNHGDPEKQDKGPSQWVREQCPEKEVEGVGQKLQTFTLTIDLGIILTLPSVTILPLPYWLTTPITTFQNNSWNSFYFLILVAWFGSSLPPSRVL